MASLTVNDKQKACLVDEGEKNKFRFDWLKKIITINTSDGEMEILVGETINKVNISGKVMCSLCSDLIYYGKRGFSAIADHIKSKKHCDRHKVKRSNYTMPINFFTKSTSDLTSISASSSANSQKPLPVPVNVPLCDRITNCESLILGVLAEHNLPFTMSPVLIELSKVLAADKKALCHLSMARTTASYKMKLGLAKTFFEETVNNLKENKFSLNIDEATSSSYKRVVCLLVSYFSPALNKVVVEHFDSFSIISVNSESLFLKISALFEKWGIPWSNLVSVLLDSCNVMRGSKTGLETRIRKMAPHLLDIDGDSCHHIHNACKAFCMPFDGYVEKYLRDTYNDLKWSVDLRKCLEDICLILGLKYTAVDNMVQHRWLSCYDVSVSNLRIQDALTVLYYGFLKADDKVTYFSFLSIIYKRRNVGAEGRAKIKELHNYISKKKMTPEGKARKCRLISKLFYESKKTKLIMHFYSAALPLLKRYICLFQLKEPLIHKLHDEQEQLLLDFLSCFLKQELLKDKRVKQLMQLDVSIESHKLKPEQMFLGETTKSLVLANKDHPSTALFLEAASEAYVKCSQYLIKTLPLDNQLLKCISAIDPAARGHSSTLCRLKKLPDLIQNVLSSSEKDKYGLEIHLYQVDKSLPPFIEDGKSISIDIWWSKMFLCEKYRNLSKIVKAVLSCFHGPQVESSFSMMGDVLDKQSSRMDIETFSSIQTVKYKLLSEDKTAIDFFKKTDYLHDPINRNLCQNMRTSHIAYKDNLQKKKEELDEKKKNLNITSNACSKTKAIEAIKIAEKNARLKHKRKLELLVKQKQHKKMKF